MIFNEDFYAFLKFPKYQVCNVFIISQKKVRDEVDFLHADKHQVCYKLVQHFQYQRYLQGDTVITDEYN